MGKALRHGRARQMRLGPLYPVSLAEARERARQARQILLRSARDPNAKKGMRLALRVPRQEWQRRSGAINAEMLYSSALFKARAEQTQSWQSG